MEAFIFLLVWFFVGGFIWGMIGLVVGLFKQRPGAGFLLGFLLWPIGVIIAALIQSGSQICPHCRGRMMEGAVVCKCCGREKHASASSDYTRYASPQPGGQRQGKTIKFKSKTAPAHPYATPTPTSPPARQPVVHYPKPQPKNIEAACPCCGQPITIPADFKGVSNCPVCKQPFNVE